MTVPPILNAVGARSVDCLQILVKYGADINLPFGANKITPLHGAVKEGTLNIVETLVQLGANVNIENAKGENTFIFCYVLWSSLYYYFFYWNPAEHLH